MHDAFDFSHHEDTLKSIKPKSKQAQILTLLLQDVCTCCDFIQSYAKDAQFCTSSSSSLLTIVIILLSGKRTFSNISGGQDKKIKDLSDVLTKRRTDFFNQAIISVEITVFQILDDVAKISSQLEYLSIQVSEIGG